MTVSPACHVYADLKVTFSSALPQSKGARSRLRTPSPPEVSLFADVNEIYLYHTPDT